MQADDIKLDDCAWLVGSEVVVTEKLDGGNCCLWRGGVYARTHAHEATHPWFASIKALYPSFAASVDDDLMLFGENMSAVHSVEYDRLGAHFYLFGVRRVSTSVKSSDRRMTAAGYVIAASFPEAVLGAQCFFIQLRGRWPRTSMPVHAWRDLAEPDRRSVVT